jgi:hypothetical protein
MGATNFSGEVKKNLPIFKNIQLFRPKLSTHFGLTLKISGGLPFKDKHLISTLLPSYMCQDLV